MILDLVLELVVFELIFIAGALGRAACAALAGMRVEAIVFGIGPPVARWRRLQLAAIPLGAFCRVAGCDPCEEPVPAEDPRAFHNRPLLLRLFVALGWPIGVELALAAFTAGTFLVIGLPVVGGGALVGEVSPGSPAERAGLRPGDEIVAIEGQAVDTTGFGRTLDASGDRESRIEVRRDGGTVFLRVRPVLAEGRYRLGIRIAPTLVTVRPGLGRALVEGVRAPFFMQKRFLAGLVEVYSRRVEAEVIGPVGMAAIVGRAPSAAQKAQLFSQLGAICALFALLPLPPLPGARFWMVLAGWRGPRNRSPVAARDADVVERPRPRFPLALLGALLPLGLFTAAETYAAATLEPLLALTALVPLAFLVALAQRRPRAWSIGVLVLLALRPGSPADPLVLVINFAVCLAIFTTLHVTSVRRAFGLACPVCGRVAARPVPASRRTACMACGSSWIAVTTSA